MIMLTTLLEEIAEASFEPVKQQMAAGTASTSFVLGLLSEEGMESEGEYYIKWAALVTYTGGTDTIISAIHGFLLAMTLYPDVLVKAQAEIDSVIGDQRLPLLSDMTHLPYIDAVIREVLR